MQQRGLQMPVLLRIDNLLEAQIKLLNESFAKAIASLGYQSKYQGVFPIKVNQLREVVEEILDLLPLVANGGLVFFHRPILHGLGEEVERDARSAGSVSDEKKKPPVWTEGSSLRSG